MAETMTEPVAYSKTMAPEASTHANTATMASEAASEAASAMAIPGVDDRDHQAIGRQQHQEY
jgi:hypothetical protein